MKRAPITRHKYQAYEHRVTREQVAIYLVLNYYTVERLATRKWQGQQQQQQLGRTEMYRQKAGERRMHPIYDAFHRQS